MICDSGPLTSLTNIYQRFLISFSYSPPITVQEERQNIFQMTFTWQDFWILVCLTLSHLVMGERSGPSVPVLKVFLFFFLSLRLTVRKHSVLITHFLLLLPSSLFQPSMILFHLHGAVTYPTLWLLLIVA